MSFLQNAKLLAPRIVGVRYMGKGPAGEGKAGAIREAGGAFGRLEAAREEEFFYKKQQEQLKKLKSEQIGHSDFHEQQIKEHEAAIQRHKESLAKLKK